MTKVRRPGIYRLVFRPLGGRDPDGNWRDEDGGEEARRDANRQTTSLAGLAITLAVLVLCLFLVRQLARVSALDDCLLSGQHSCDLLLTRLR